MVQDLSELGTVETQASAAVTTRALEQWAEAAAAAGVSMEGFDPDVDHQRLVAWAVARGLIIGALYSRYSTKMQQSTEDQIRECVIWAARHGMFIPPKFISVDEAVKGKQSRRAGLTRTKRILASRQARVLLVYKASRLFRNASKGFQFIQEDIVEEGLRAVSVSQGIDTDDKKTWKLQLQVHGVMDDILLDAIADHVRDGQKGLFLQNLTTGALGVGYIPEVVPNGRPTNRGKARTRVKIDPVAAPLIRKHAQLLLAGMKLREGVRRWNAAGGPWDPRSTTGKMSYNAYRRLFANPRLTGRWEFGRKRNQFSSKCDYVKQIEQPDDEVLVKHFEELRILDDKTFFALQRMFDERRTGPRGPREQRTAKLWDLTTDCFSCSHCSSPDKPVRFHMGGANGRGMRCSNGDACPSSSCVRREEAVKAVCQELADVIDAKSSKLAEFVSRESANVNQSCDDTQVAINSAESRLEALNHRIAALYELYGDSVGDDRAEAKARLRTAQAERNTVRAELENLRGPLDGSRNPLSKEEVLTHFSEMSSLLRRAADDRLDGEDVYEALKVFRLLTGERILVDVQPRPGRKQTIVQATVRPRLYQALSERSGRMLAERGAFESIKFWLRKPPRIDILSERVHELMDIQQLSYRTAAKRLQVEGHNVNSGNVWYYYRRWYEMQGLPVPEVPYNNGNERRGAS